MSTDTDKTPTVTVDLESLYKRLHAAESAQENSRACFASLAKQVGATAPVSGNISNAIEALQKRANSAESQSAMIRELNEKVLDLETAEAGYQERLAVLGRTIQEMQTKRDTEIENSRRLTGIVCDLLEVELVPSSAEKTFELVVAAIKALRSRANTANVLNDNAMRAEVDRLMPSIEDLDRLVTPMPTKWLDDHAWDDYETRTARPPAAPGGEGRTQGEVNEQRSDNGKEFSENAFRFFGKLAETLGIECESGDPSELGAAVEALVAAARKTVAMCDDAGTTICYDSGLREVVGAETETALKFQEDSMVIGRSHSSPPGSAAEGPTHKVPDVTKLDVDAALKSLHCLRLELPEAVANDAIPAIQQVIRKLAIVHWSDLPLEPSLPAEGPTGEDCDDEFAPPKPTVAAEWPADNPGVMRLCELIDRVAGLCGFGCEKQTPYTKVNNIGQHLLAQRHGITRLKKAVGYLQRAHSLVPAQKCENCAEKQAFVDHDSDEIATSGPHAPSPPPVSAKEGQAPPATLEQCVRDLIASNAVHNRKGTVMGKETWSTVFEHLREEMNEAALSLSAVGTAEFHEELGDILGIVVHMIIKAGLSVAEVEEMEIEKLAKRFAPASPPAPAARPAKEGQAPPTEADSAWLFSADLTDLIRHCYTHSGFPKCGYDQMTTDQKRLFDQLTNCPAASPPAPAAEADTKLDAAIRNVFGVTAQELDAAWEECVKTHGKPSELFRLATHLKECQSCRKAFESYQSSPSPPVAAAPETETLRLIRSRIEHERERSQRVADDASTPKLRDGYLDRVSALNFALGVVRDATKETNAAVAAASQGQGEGGTALEDLANQVLEAGRKHGELRRSNRELESEAATLRDEHDKMELELADAMIALCGLKEVYDDANMGWGDVVDYAKSFSEEVEASEAWFKKQLFEVAQIAGVKMTDQLAEWGKVIPALKAAAARALPEGAVYWAPTPATQSDDTNA